MPPRNDYGYLSDQEAADVLSNGHPKSEPVDLGYGFDDGSDNGSDNGDDGECDCDPILDDNCDCLD